ncbi:YoaK family protein [Paraburkholderia solisilvae]|uniref:DUF1275 domain-containing protein n=1 Tax=Paraburkholderia solisilvae TaxID=624376 RepID=A0A6J5DQT2_9BURK|nr:YoaK family protein [Paraburkholderia solisilvae]CAB3756338.1 hypothetical protein LMG29739_02423 [Paraburkholderia solisilvae]
MNMRAETSLAVVLRRVAALSSIAGYVEVIGFKDFGGIYPGIMTGNTVQLSLTLAKAQWAHFGIVGFAVGLFFIGGMIASIVRWHLRRPPLQLLAITALLIAAGCVRLIHPSERFVELALLAVAMAMQGETLAKFGGVSLQTIVVTNNMVKFSDAFVGRYLVGSMRRASAAHGSTTIGRPELKEVLMPGLAWVSYSIGAAAGAILTDWFRFPFVVPVLLLVLIVCDLLRSWPDTDDTLR